MRKFILALPLLLVSCATPGGMTPAQLDALIAQVQAYTATACAFRPTAESVAALITALYPQAIPVAVIGGAVGEIICRAPVASATVRRRGPTTVIRVVNTASGPIAVRGYRLSR